MLAHINNNPLPSEVSLNRTEPISIVRLLHPHCNHFLLKRLWLLMTPELLCGP